MDGSTTPTAAGLPGRPRVSSSLWWQAKQLPPICPTCQTYCRCRRTMMKEDAKIQYRYCETCDYKMKTVVPLR